MAAGSGRTGALSKGLALAAAGAGGVILERRHLRRIASDPQRAVLENPPRGQPLRVHSADGTALYAEVFGSEELPTLVLSHGWTEGIHYWALMIRELSSDFRIVAYDLRGHGQSARAAGGDYSLARFGEDLAAVLAGAVPEGHRAVVAGHSLGAMSIAAWAQYHDVTQIRAAALLFTGLGSLVAEQLLVPVARVAHRVRDPIARRAFFGARLPLPRFSSPPMHAALRYIAFGPGATPALVAFWERMLVSCAADVRAAVGLALADMELHQALGRLTVPALVMTGELDRLTPPSHGRRMSGALPHLYRLIELPETGHMGPLERPAEIADALRELARASDSPALTADRNDLAQSV